MSNPFRFFLLGLLVMSLGSVPGLAAESAVTGRVVGPKGEPIRNARVQLIERNRATLTDADGRFRFDGVSAGSYHIEAVARGLGSGVVELTVADQDVSIEMIVNRSVHREQIVVTATRTGHGTGEVIQPVQAVDQGALTEKMQPTIGETLSQEAGVHSTYYSPGASRPIIRGKGGSRIRVLEGGLGVGDASAASPDHAVSYDPLSAERVELLRGPSSLLYGGAAVGGVVNLIDERVPEFAPQRKLAGELNLRGASAADERAGSLMLHGGVGHFAWRVQGLGRETDDYAIPGNAVRDEPSGPRGTLPNSSIETTSGTLGFSWVGEKGFFGGAARTFDSDYGIPVLFSEGGEDVLVRLDMEQKRYDLRGGFDTSWGRVDGVRFSLGATDYEHREINILANKVGTRFLNESLEGRLEFTHGEGGKLPGVFGLQLGSEELEAIGEEAFLPPAATDALALFGLQGFYSGPMHYELGLRYGRTEVDAERVCSNGKPCATDADCAGIGEGECALNPDRDFDVLSGSFGLAWVPNESYTVAASLSHGERAPTAQELYANGPHPATASFELGDPTLRKESSLGIDLSLRKRAGRVSGEWSLFAQRFRDFIFEVPTGEEDDGLPVVAFTQADAEFYGTELRLLVELFYNERHDLDLELFGDTVRTENRETHAGLPYMPPDRAGLGMTYEGASWNAAARITWADEKQRVVRTEFDVADFTPSYTMVDASVGYRFITRRIVHQLLLRGKNLTDEQARVNSSRLRDRVPLPGRDVSLSYQLVF